MPRHCSCNRWAFHFAQMLRRRKAFTRTSQLFNFSVRGRLRLMGKIIAAMGTVHAPQLFVRPPSEDPAQLDADIAAMRLLGKDLDEAKPDVALVIGNDHMETFFLTSVPTFAILAGERSRAEFARKNYDLPIHQGLAEDLLDKLVNAGFDMAYSQDAVLGHAFAAVYEWVIE